MPNKIKPKRSYTTNSVPLTTDLETNELAINWADGKAFTKDANGQIVSVKLGGSGGGGSGLSWATAPASADAAGTAGQIAYDGDYFYVATATNTWKRTTLSSWSLDDYIQYVALLLHCDGSGATFTDTSSTPKTVTANGGATQSATQSKWGGKSAYFDGSGFLTFGSADLSLGSADFAVEMWVFPTQTQTAFLADWRTTPNGPPTLYLQNNVVNWYADVLGQNVGTGVTLANNVWSHVAVARSGSSLRIYINGTQAGNTVSDSSNYPGSGGLRIGRHDSVYFYGYMDDIRITKGSARGYTGSTITVPTAALPDP